MADVYSRKPWLKHYDAHVPPTLEYPAETLPELLGAACRRLPRKAALIYMGRRLTFAELDLLSSQAAHFLRARGLDRGETVGVQLPNIPAGYLALAAIQKAGGVHTGVSPLIAPAELELQLRDSGAKVLFTLDVLLDRVRAAVTRTGVQTVVVSSIGDFLPPLTRALGTLLKKIPAAAVRPIAGVEVVRLRDALAGMPTTPPEVRVTPDDPCFMMYTGGTTGPSKGAVLTHRSVAANRRQSATWLDLHEEDTVLSAFPIFHIAGLFLAVAAGATGATQIAVPDPRNTRFLTSAIRKYHPAAVINVPTVFLELMKRPDFRRLRFERVKWLLTAAAPFPPANIEELEGIVGRGKLLELYGMTETSPVMTCLPRHGTKKPGSVGMPLSDTEIRLADPETGEAVPIGTPGEVLVRGPQVFRGYHGRPEETAHALRDGWLHTGDVATMDEDGYFYLVDRLKDMVNVSGYKVFTREVDDLLTAHPDVELAATIGLPDPARPGAERVVAAVVLKPGVARSEETRAALARYLREGLAAYKVPRTIELVDELPTSAVGKVLKRELRRRLAERGAGEGR